MLSNKKFIRSFEGITIHDMEQVGGKNASLGEMIGNLTKGDIRVPMGFAITVASYRYYLTFNNLEKHIADYLQKIDFDDIVSLRRNASRIRQLILNGRFPENLATKILMAYKTLSERYGETYTDVAVRSSSTAEDLPEASFAGQQESYLNVKGNTSVLNSVLNCFASLYTDRAISYRNELGVDQMEVGISVGIQKMVRSDIGVSGVAFSLDTESGFKDVIQINAIWGLGELLVKGAITPDEFITFKKTLGHVKNPILEKKMGNKEMKMCYSSNLHERVRTTKVEPAMQQKFCMSDEQIVQLSHWVQQIEAYYSEKNKQWTPVDVEWAIDGLTNELYIVQARPETVHSKVTDPTFSEFKMVQGKDDVNCLLEGIAVGDRVGRGKVRVLYGMDGRDGSLDPAHFKKGEVLVTDMTDPDWEPIMKKASAIVTNKGGRTCHAAIVARELGIPAIVGVSNATDVLTQEQEITVSCAEGEVGKVYEGNIDYVETKYSIKDIEPVETPIMLNVGSPDQVFQYGHLPVAGVGLAREEFIINNYIGVHPMALLRHNELGDHRLSQKIATITSGYPDERTFFIDRLAQGIAKIAATFFPGEVVVRFSDFKTNEYLKLLGGAYFEPMEQNPMIGWRGASRYYSENYIDAFQMECEAIKKVRDEMGLHNVIPMIPFCRTVDECKKVLKVMEDFGLKRGQNGLQVYLMAELPANFILADEFAQYIDGFSIGSNDLTQLTLGIDRDSSLISDLYNENNGAVTKMITHLIEVSKESNVKVGICGQGPSDDLDFAAFLIRNEIDSISVTPDAYFKTVCNAARAELKSTTNPQ